MTAPPHIPQITATDSTEARELRVRDGSVRTTSLAPTFGEPAVGEWAVDIKTEPRLELPRSSVINQLVAGKPRLLIRLNRVRYTDGRLVARVANRARFVQGYLPTPAEAVLGVFEDHGVTASPSSAHRYIAGMAELLGSSKVLERSGVRDLILKLQFGKSKTVGQMCELLKAGDDGPDLIDSLVERRVLFRGLELICERCGLRYWYPIDELNEIMTCQGCHSLIRPPIGAEFSFRLNGLAAQAAKQGAIPVLLTARFLRSLIWGDPLSLYGLNYDLGVSQAEADYVTSAEGDLILCECKDFRSGGKPEDVEKAESQIASLIRLAQRIHAAAAVLATLMPIEQVQYAGLASAVQSLAEANRDVIIHLIALDRMALVDLREPTRTVSEPHLFDSTLEGG